MVLKLLDARIEENSQSVEMLEGLISRSMKMTSEMGVGVCKIVSVFRLRTAHYCHATRTTNDTVQSAHPFLPAIRILASLPMDY